MDKLLPLLIEQARSARDRQAAASARAQQALAQSQAVLQRLADYRVETLARTPAARLAHAHPGTLPGYGQFITRLDDAIGLQQHEAALREQRVEAERAALVQREQRLRAFESLQRRRTEARAARELRREQRTMDDLAAFAWLRGRKDAG